MLQSVSILYNNRIEISQENAIENFKTTLEVSSLLKEKVTSFDIKFTFTTEIIQFRNHDYTWVGLNKDRIATEFMPKIIQLKNGNFVQANINAGIWEVNKSNPKVLWWRFNPENSAPLARFTGELNNKKIINADINFNFLLNPALLFSASNSVEFSRSKIPFSAIACFTDHCDFDTSANLKMQREFFKDNSIKVTKGFFLNDYSKRTTNASFVSDEIELKEWRSDGHELAYHSLSQSLKSEEESLDDFFKFIPPFDDITTWIDHGYQYYNFSQIENKKIANEDLERCFKSKNIDILWNYLDNGASTTGVINQLNQEDFTLSKYYQGIKDLNFKNRIRMLIKGIIFHHYADEKMLLKYKMLKISFKKLFLKKKIASIFPLLFNFIDIAIPILKVIVFWNFHKSKPFKLAKYSPLLFKYKIDKTDFFIFQTIEMVDFEKSMSPKNIDKLITEKGVFIAHTYFATPIAYHAGKIFGNQNTIENQVTKNFNYLGEKIQTEEIWNPTLKELISYLSNFEHTILDVDNEGKIVVTNASGLLYRSIN